MRNTCKSGQIRLKVFDLIVVVSRRRIDGQSRAHVTPIRPLAREVRGKAATSYSQGIEEVRGMPIHGGTYRWATKPVYLRRDDKAYAGEPA